jgi:hypothetical protein
MESKVAERLNALIARTVAHLDQSIAYVRDTCSKEEFEVYRRSVGQVMGILYVEVEEKLWSEHPHLRPRKMGGTHEPDPSVLEPPFYGQEKNDV